MSFITGSLSSGVRRGAAGLILAVVATGCAGGPTGEPSAGGPSSGQDGGQVLAVATVYPLAWLAGEIAPGADTHFLGARGQDPHDLELSPRDREAVETADVLLYMGDLDFQPQVERAVAGASGEVVDVAQVAGQQRLRALAEGDQGDDQADGHGDEHRDEHGDEHGDDAEEGDDEDAERRAIDPHVWFDVTVMADVARRAGEAFAAVDPGHAAEYTANADAAARDLTALDARIDRAFADCRFDTVIVSHAAYGYLLHPRGLEQEGISGAGGHGEASPQRLASLIERIGDERIPAIAAEPVEGRADAEVLAAESGAQLVEIDPLEVVEEPGRGTGFPQLLLEQAAAFATALDCAR